MPLKKINFKTQQELIDHIKTHKPSFYFSSRTSTVIPYDKLEEVFTLKDFYLADLSSLPSSLELKGDNLLIKGPVTWQDAKSFLKSQGRNIKTAPTEELALISSGAATSATGERCFHFGNLRSQIKKIVYFNYKGEEKTLLSKNKLNFNCKGLEAYCREFYTYEEFKNAPFPRLETQTDLLIGTEGQLGIINEIEIETTKNDNIQHLFMLLPKWEENSQAHLEVIQKIQNFKSDVYLCELIDSNSFTYLTKDERPNKGLDAIFFEIKESFFETFYEDFLLSLSFLNEEDVFEISENKFHNLRASIPRAVFEENSKMGITKMGTDIQVRVEDFDKLLKLYHRFSTQGTKYNLFGHFGDAHLHFNFMPREDEILKCHKEFEYMYTEIKKWQASPFAEHGIGIIKQKYIRDFWSPSTFNVFRELKNEHDPYNQFFPQGYMNLVQRLSTK